MDLLPGKIKSLQNKQLPEWLILQLLVISKKNGLFTACFPGHQWVARVLVVGLDLKIKNPQKSVGFKRQKGIEPSSPAWKAGVMSHYTTAA